MASNRISPDEANARVLAGEPMVFVDARNAKDWSESSRKIPGAIRITADDLPARLDEIDRDATVITYCTCPNEESSVALTQVFRDNGYRAFALRGGFNAWAAAEYPLERKLKAA
ncbi:MAG TPA: rhodanese-like domain-containing protein [Terriglobia bacterium]|jgi:rhodanese-related sulfurtransferase